MLVKIQLKNSDRAVTVDDKVYEYISTNSYLKNLDFEHNLREHSSGRPVFQKSWRKSDGSYKVETIYLHKLIAEKFIPRPDDEARKYVKICNGNPLDCRIANLDWSTKSDIKRNIRKTTNKTGYIGVAKDKYHYRAIIYINRKPQIIGKFKTAQEAALAYNKKSIEMFGPTRNLNRVKEAELPENSEFRNDKELLRISNREID